MRQLSLQILTFPFFSLGKPSQSLTSCPNWLQRPQGLGLFGLNSSLIMVKLGSCVARPSMMRSAINNNKKLNSEHFEKILTIMKGTGHHQKNKTPAQSKVQRGTQINGKAKKPNTSQQSSANKMSSRYTWAQNSEYHSQSTLGNFPF